MVDLDESLSKSKDEYMDSILSFTKNKTSDNLILCMRNGTKYFNKAEKLVASSKLDGKHNDGLWVTDLAESCEEILGSYLIHVKFLDEYNHLIDNSYKKPKRHACSSMQRMVKKHCPQHISDKLRLEFINAKLPTTGFDVEESEDKNKMDIYLPVGIGIFFMLISFSAALILKEPTQSQFFAIRGMFSLGGAGVGSCIPGWLNVNVKGYVKAGGALAIFVILWLLNPPAFVMN
ncbi:hypothetical protein [Dickeya fangzhongdai]|uniref:hypothetical protein n=1 Tax=Dickeya fangzhongdai TaxID=1778540 RepID=UPI000676A900|nr:hypothetical protein [Dickeya fangzhongdai]